MTKQVEQGVHCDYAASGKAPRCYEAASRRPTATDKTTGKLLVNSVHAEPGAPTDKEVFLRDRGDDRAAGRISRGQGSRVLGPGSEGLAELASLTILAWEDILFGQNRPGRLTAIANGICHG